MPTTSVTGLNVVTIYVSDLVRAEEFYVHRLGFARDSVLPPGLLLRAGGVMVYLEGGRESRPEDTSKQSQVCPCFAVESVKASYDALVDVGVPVVAYYQKFGPEFAMFMIADPDGNHIEFAGKP